MEHNNNRWSKWVTAAIIIVLLVAIGGVGYHIYSTQEGSDLQPNSVTNTVKGHKIPLITDKSVNGIFALGDNMSKTVESIKESYITEKIVTGDNPDDFNYVLRQDGKIKYILQNIKGNINTIFVLDSVAQTDNGLHVGDTFGKLLALYPDADFRLGETDDWVHGSCELCKAGNMIFVRWLTDDGKQLADYSDDYQHFSLRKDSKDLTIDEIIVTTATW